MQDAGGRSFARTGPLPQTSSPARGRDRERASGRAAWQSPGRAKDGLPPRPPDRSPGQALPRKRGEGGKSGRLHARRDNRICAMRIRIMTFHDASQGRLATPQDVRHGAGFRGPVLHPEVRTPLSSPPRRRGPISGPLDRLGGATGALPGASALQRPAVRSSPFRDGPRISASLRPGRRKGSASPTSRTVTTHHDATLGAGKPGTVLRAFHRTAMAGRGGGS